jgi:SAM-dependent MidA family methyltransferase
MIEQKIRDRGPMPFSRYMEICLYDPAEGYYSRNAEQFGKAGDFYTSSDVHAVFGRLLARQFDQMWQALDRPPEIELLELGPGRGLFARDVLDWSKKKLPELFAALRYTLQESSPALRAKLQENLREHMQTGKAAIPEERPNLAQRFSAGKIGEHEQVPEGRPTHIHRTCPSATPLIVFANEFFDALPVEILSTEGKLHLALEDNRLHEVWLPTAAEEMELLDRYGVHPEPGERIEVCRIAQDWMTQIAHSIAKGFLLMFDYGYTRAEQLAGHHRGTLMAYRHHSATPNPYQSPGEQDLTAHVNFTALSAAAGDAGLDIQPLRTQSQFLMRIGEANQFSDAFEDCRLPQEHAKVALQLKHLVTPAGMGETFQVLVASRGVDGQSLK